MATTAKSCVGAVADEARGVEERRCLPDGELAGAVLVKVDVDSAAPQESSPGRWSGAGGGRAGRGAADPDLGARRAEVGVVGKVNATARACAVVALRPAGDYTETALDVCVDADAAAQP